MLAQIKLGGVVVDAVELLGYGTGGRKRAYERMALELLQMLWRDVQLEFGFDGHDGLRSGRAGPAVRWSCCRHAGNAGQDALLPGGFRQSRLPRTCPGGMRFPSLCRLFPTLPAPVWHERRGRQ